MRAQRNIFVEAPRRPEPIELAIQEVLSWDDLKFRWGSTEPQEKARYIKRCMVQKLAAALIDRLEPFIVRDYCSDGEAYRIQVILSDRGAYENWLPAERRLGWNEGYQSGEAVMRKQIPYGMEPGQFYE